MALSPIGRPSRPKFGLRGHWKTGGSPEGVTVATVPAAPGKATVVVVAPNGVPAEVPAKTKKILFYFETTLRYYKLKNLIASSFFKIQWKKN